MINLIGDFNCFLKLGPRSIMSPTCLDLQVEVDPTQLTQKLGTLSKDKRNITLGILSHHRGCKSKSNLPCLVA